MPGLAEAVASRLTANAAALEYVGFFAVTRPAANVLKLGEPAGACP